MDSLDLGKHNNHSAIKKTIQKHAHVRLARYGETSDFDADFCIGKKKSRRTNNI